MIQDVFVNNMKIYVGIPNTCVTSKKIECNSNNLFDMKKCLQKSACIHMMLRIEPPNEMD